MCRLVFKQGLHTWNTCPLLIILFRSENIVNKQHADVQAYPMDEDTIAMLNAPNRPQLQRASIKFGRFIKLNNINVKVSFKQADIGFTAEAVFFLGGKGGVSPKKRL